MNAIQLQSMFERMERLSIGELSATRHRPYQPLTLDIRRDSKGEFFDIQLRPDANVEMAVVDLRKRDRHLLLHTKTDGERHLFLCGHDERHWFVAAIPENAPGVSNVPSAMEALKPPEVLEAQARQGVKGRDRMRRKNAAYRRQGEWFFLPEPTLKVDKQLILHNEPLSRGNGGKAHYAEFCYRTGGETVYVSRQHPAGLTKPQFDDLIARTPKARKWGWREMRRNALVYVKGRISHPDHQTIGLFVWHRVVMNTENQAKAMRHVVFLD